MDEMKNLDCNQIKIFINLEIIGEKKLYIYIFKKKKKFKHLIFFFIFYNMVKSLGATTVSKPNFYYIIIYDIVKLTHNICFCYL